MILFLLITLFGGDFHVSLSKTEATCEKQMAAEVRKGASVQREGACVKIKVSK